MKALTLHQIDALKRAQEAAQTAEYVEKQQSDFENSYYDLLYTLAASKVRYKVQQDSVIFSQNTFVGEAKYTRNLTPQGQVVILKNSEKPLDSDELLQCLVRWNSSLPEFKKHLLSHCAAFLFSSLFAITVIYLYRYGYLHAVGDTIIKSESLSLVMLSALLIFFLIVWTLLTIFRSFITIVHIYPALKNQ